MCAGGMHGSLPTSQGAEGAWESIRLPRGSGSIRDRSRPGLPAGPTHSAPNMPSTSPNGHDASAEQPDLPDICLPEWGRCRIARQWHRQRSLIYTKVHKCQTLKTIW
ncbi:hypothetical protein AvCA_18770 [Azotobacter vinelandii CA]|uniref:Uncharacterized protein n=2 Tax=Azotobacter vinelandii TaxID=354 RepID=C1DDW8_AZOVD|nr:hypothetical protein Avin_18770 [Azotobacter vinelandii DJ]AGK16870.1 hypothetical protein AvCA_18770 [Azotobacter vinelandii CA]AGK20244.1 hypothetical protein AvCA6_18770 [Azotobacter vinelandii CA6]